MDHQRDLLRWSPADASQYGVSREFGCEASFDVIFTDFRWYRSLDQFTIGQSGRPPVFALQMKGRFTEDAPLSGFSSVSLPGYTMGNYLSEDYAHLDGGALSDHPKIRAGRIRRHWLPIWRRYLR